MKTASIQIILHTEEFAWLTGLIFRGITISENGAWWNLIIRARTPEGTPVYARTIAPDIQTGFDDFITALSGKGGKVLWHFDRYADK